MIDFTFQNNPIQLFFGEGKLTEVAQRIRSHGTKVLLVFGGSSFKENGYHQDLVAALSKEGVTALDFGKTGDWTLMPLTGLMQNYLNIPYTKALTIIFPHFLKEVYHGDRVFHSYFQNVLGIPVEGKSDEQVLEEGLNRLWEIYRSVGAVTTFRELTEVPADHEALRTTLASPGTMPSQYEDFTPERLARILLHAIG